MTATHAEVMRSLPPELEAARATDGAFIRGSDGAKRWELELAPERRRQLGGLELPVTDLVIRLTGYSSTERDRFLERLEQCCRRAGG